MRFYTLFITCLFCSSFSFGANTKGYHISNIVKTDEVLSPYIFVIEKGKHLLHLYSHNKGIPKRIVSYPMASGKVPGDKEVQGDKKTPEGIYFLEGFYNSEQLIKMYGDYGKIYGIGAFTSNYPNPVDILDGKTGDGIWLHSTNDVSRIKKRLDSRGCVVVNDDNLKELSKYININYGTPYIVVQNLDYWDGETFQKHKGKLEQLISSWSESWKNQDLKKYLSHYDRKVFRTRNGRNFKQFYAHKKRVFRNTKFAKIELSNISIFTFRDYTVVRLKQSYESNLMNDVGLKTIYFRMNKNYQWKIVREQWQRSPKETELAFSKNNKGFFE